MHADVRIEPFSHRHADQVFELILPIQTEEFGIKITRQDQPDLSCIPDFYQKGNGNFWVAVAGDQVVGSVALLDIGNRQLALRKMFVRPHYRGKDKGVAKRLLGASIAWAKDRCASDIFLGTTAQFLAAHRFYAKNGFAEIEKGALPASFPVMAVDTKFYHYRFG
jgi:GNAT superfamily N-acetyltransferase